MMLFKRIRKINRRAFFAAAVVASLAELTRTAHGQTVTYTGLDLDLQDNSLLTAIGLNASEQVVGYTTSGSTQLPFVYTPHGSGTGFTTIPGIPSNSGSKATGISNAGVVVGSDGVTKNGFVYSFGTSSATEVAPISSGTLTFSGVNNNGIAVGTSSTASGGTTLITYNILSGQKTDVGTGFTGTANSSSGTAINDSNTVLGYGIQNAPPTNGYPAHIQPFIATPAGGGYSYTNVGNAVETAIPTGGSYPGYYSPQGLSANGEVSGTIAPYANGGFGTGTGYIFNTSTGVINTGYTSQMNAVADVNGVPEGVGAAYLENYTGPGGGYVHGFDAVTYTSSGGMVNIYNAIPNYTLSNAIAVNSAGDILAQGYLNGDTTNTLRYLLLTVNVSPNVTYTGAVSNAWNTTSANFTPNNYANGDSVTFDDSATGSTTVNIPSSVTPTSVIFNNSSKSYVITGAAIGGTATTVTLKGSGSVTLNNSNTYAGATNVGSGSLTIGSTGSLASSNITSGNNTSITVQSGGAITSTALNLVIGIGSTFTIAPTTPAKVVLQLTSLNANTGFLDVGNTDLIFHNYSSGVAGTIGVIAGGYNHGTWQGNGIISTAAKNNTSHLTTLGTIQNSGDQTPSGTAIYSTFDGVPVVNTDVLVKYTYYGDANLDGKVDGSDYSLIDNAFVANQSGDSFPLSGWYNGDFNYDGVIDGSDYTLIDNAFNTQGAAFSGSVPNALVTDLIAPPSEATAVPEPSTLALMSVVLLSTWKKRLR